MEVPKNLLNANTPQKQLSSNDKKMLPEGEKKSGGWLMFVIGLIIGVLVMWIFGGTKGSEDATKTSELSTTTAEDLVGEDGEEVSTNLGQVEVAPTENTTVGTDSLTVQNQSSGATVFIETLNVTASTWVAVHDVKSDGILGNILGARRFEPGMRSGVVELLRNTVSGTNYSAVMYRDNGDREFNKNTDTKITNVAGSLIEARFRTE